MAYRQRASLLAFSALLFCILARQTAGSHRSGSSSSSTASPEARGWINERTAPNWIRQTSNASERRPAPPHDSSVNTSRDFSAGFRFRGPQEEVSPICAYRVIEGGIWGQLCFRRTQFGFECRKEDCRSTVSLGDLVANILTNGSVLLQWRSADAADGTNATTAGTPAAASEERRRRRGGFELSCWWNGSYTQFECASVHLGSGCRDFLLTELHENTPYRICVRALPGPERERAASRRNCVEFTLPPSRMQDIVIAMTTVGGAICVMLVIICLLVAYITENIMSPTNQLAHSYRTHSCH